MTTTSSSPSPSGPAPETPDGTSGGRVYVANLFTLKPGADVDELVRRMREGIETTSSHNPGYVGDTVLRSVDGTNAMNLSAWNGGTDRVVRNYRGDQGNPTYLQEIAGVTELAEMVPQIYVVAYAHGDAPIAGDDETVRAPAVGTSGSTVDLADDSEGEATAADVQRWIDAWNSHDLDRILDLFTDDVVMHQPQNPRPLSKQQLAHFFSMTFSSYEDIHFEPQGHVIRGLDAASWERVTGTMSGPFTDPSTGRQIPPTHRRFDILGAMHLTYAATRRGGEAKIKEVRIYWDRLQLDQQLGLIHADA